MPSWGSDLPVPSGRRESARWTPLRRLVACTGAFDLKILHVYRTYFPDPPGGLQEAIRQICISTKRHGAVSEVFTLSPRPVPAELIRAEGRVVRSRSWAAPGSCDLGGVKAFRLFAVVAASADVIHYHYPWPFADLLHRFVRPGKPTVMTYHSDIVRQAWLGKIYGPLRNRMLGSMDEIVATSSAYAASSPVLSNTELASRLRVIPLGIDEETYTASTDDNIFQRIGLKVGEPYFLFLGVIRYYKGLHILVRSASRVGARIVIAGSGPVGEDLRRLADSLGVKSVIFSGQVEEGEKIALLRRCRAVVLPSNLRSEAYGMALVEAAMFGKPMISCEIGTGTSFVNAHEKTGLVVPPESPEELASAMNRLLDDSDLADRYGKAARQRYEKVLSGEAMGRAYAQLYQGILRR